MMDNRKFRRKRKSPSPEVAQEPKAAPVVSEAERAARAQAEEAQRVQAEENRRAQERAAQEKRAARQADEARQARRAAEKAERDARAHALQVERERADAAEKKRAAEEAEREAARQAEEQAKADAKQKADERKRAEAEALRIKQAKRLAEEQRIAAAKAAEQAEREAKAKRLAEEQARQEKERRAEEKRVAEAKAAEQAEREAKKKAEEQRRLEAQKRAKAREAARVAEAQARAEKQRAEEELRQAEEAKRASEAQAAAALKAQAEADELAMNAPEPSQPKLAAPPVQETMQPRDPWLDMPGFTVSADHLSRNRIITAERADPAHTAFDVLRTRLLQALSDNGWNRVAITSPTKDCGKTFTAANLAISLSRQENFRTLLLDCDMRRPSLHRVMGVQKPGAMGEMLRGNVTPEQHLMRLGDNPINAGQNIAFGFNSVIEPYASELLQDPRTAKTLDAIEEKFAPDVMLFDLPPALYYDDVIAFRPMFDGVLMVIGGGTTTEKEVKEVERRLGDSTPLLGMVLNKAENTEISRYRY